MEKNLSALFTAKTRYEGTFSSKSTNHRGRFRNLTDGLVRLELFTKFADQIPWMRLTLAESNYLDSEMLIFDLYFKILTFDTNNSVLSVSVQSNSANDFNFVHQLTAKTSKTGEKVDLSLKLVLKSGIDRKKQDKYLRLDETKKIHFEMQSSKLDIKAVGELKKGAFVQQWHLPEMTFLTSLGQFVIMLVLMAVSFLTYYCMLGTLSTKEPIHGSEAFAWVSNFC